MTTLGYTNFFSAAKFHGLLGTTALTFSPHGGEWSKNTMSLQFHWNTSPDAWRRVGLHCEEHSTELM
jgi:hypothetical protein